MREKLIKILETVVSPKEVLCDGEVLVSTERVADHLIANGVTFAEDNNVPSKWIPVTERLPEYGQRVLAYSGKVFKPSVFWYIFYSEDYSMWKNEVTHWMPIPQAPEGE